MFDKSGKKPVDADKSAGSEGIGWRKVLIVAAVSLAFGLLCGALIFFLR